MSELKHRIVQLEQCLGDIKSQEAESLRRKHTDEILQCFVVEFAKKEKLIPEDYTYPEYEKALKILKNLPSVSGKAYWSKEKIDERCNRLLNAILSDKAMVRKYIPGFKKIKLKSPDV